MTTPTHRLLFWGMPLLSFFRAAHSQGACLGAAVVGPWWTGAGMRATKKGTEGTRKWGSTRQDRAGAGEKEHKVGVYGVTPSFHLTCMPV